MKVDKSQEPPVNKLQENKRYNLSEIQSYSTKAHNPEINEKSRGDHVTQIWEDGAITSQKGGELLWCRNLFTHEIGIKGVRVQMPIEYDEKLSYAFVTDEDAYNIRAMLLSMVGTDPDTDEFILNKKVRSFSSYKKYDVCLKCFNVFLIGDYKLYCNNCK